MEFENRLAGICERTSSFGSIYDYSHLHELGVNTNMLIDQEGKKMKELAILGMLVLLMGEKSDFANVQFGLTVAGGIWGLIEAKKGGWGHRTLPKVISGLVIGNRMVPLVSGNETSLGAISFGASFFYLAGSKLLDTAFLRLNNFFKDRNEIAQKEVRVFKRKEAKKNQGRKKF